nr:MAG TPA: hypothetical protein [Caudoviricetes sp.]
MNDVALLVIVSKISPPILLSTRKIVKYNSLILFVGEKT